ncbi:MAG: DUF4062 domain-containing protein [Caldilineaceae bacterium SB0666_bin_21]|nr:DUF4062 domain-containing protein [Caldilineaceae bacterium SB0666_bin_21]
MATFKVFLSSVQSEFASERASLREYFQTDPLLRETFEILLFEDIPPSEVPPDAAYLERVDQADILIGLFGLEYGTEGGDGISPTEKEYNRASDTNTHRLVFVKRAEDEHRHPKMRQLIRKAQQSLVVGQFNTVEDLRSGIQAAIVDYMKVKKLIQTGGFDEVICEDATPEDISEQAVVAFVRSAQRVRQFPLGEETSMEDVLTHLRLIKDKGVTNAAIQLFGKDPQRFRVGSEVRCAHFHGTEIEKPIPSLQVFGGTLFSQVDSAEDFVLSKINMSVGTRAESVRAPRTYEIPVEVIREAIVNAVVHRDFTSTGNVQVMIFADRLEIWNPGRLPPSLTIEKLREPHGSVPANPLLADSMFLAEYIERMGTGTLDMIRRCGEAGLPEPEFRVDDMFKVTIRRARMHECVVTVCGNGGVLADVEVLALFPNKTWKRSVTDRYGEAHFSLYSGFLPMTVFAARHGFTAGVEYNWIPVERPLCLELDVQASGGSAVFAEGTGYLPGLAGRLEPILDTYDRTYLYAANIAINDGLQQPVDFNLGDDLHLKDADGYELSVRVVDIVGRSSLIEYRSV